MDQLLILNKQRARKKWAELPSIGRSAVPMIFCVFLGLIKIYDDEYHISIDFGDMGHSIIINIQRVMQRGPDYHL